MALSPLVNPWVLQAFLRNMLWAPGRLEGRSSADLASFRDRGLRGVLRVAEGTPLYQKKYQGIDVHRVRSVSDLSLLPLVSKQEIMGGLPEGTLPRGARRRAVPLNTSGSTGKPVQFYTDFATLSMAAGSFLREAQSIWVGLADGSERAYRELHAGEGG